MFKRGMLAVICTLGVSACGGGDTFNATLNGANEKPVAVTTSATGSAKVEVKDNVATVTGSFTGLSAAATLSHIHGPADKTAAAGVICTLTATAATSGTISGTCPLTAEQVTQLSDGLLYVNVHTATNPAGEIRGQLE